MYNFFIEENNFNGDTAVITGSDFNHIKKVLRMREGEELLVSVSGFSYLCKIANFTSDSVILSVIERNCKNTELPIEIYLFQGLPKSDKFELIIQKAVELGVTKIIPVDMKRCVVKLDGKKADSKVSRWQAISESASKQSKRNLIPEVLPVTPLKQCVKYINELNLTIVPYENAEGMTATKNAFDEISKGYKVGVFIGPEGGFEDSEIEFLKDTSAKIISLGSRILRTETAAITALSAIMLKAELL